MKNKCIMTKISAIMICVMHLLQLTSCAKIAAAELSAAYNVEPAVPARGTLGLDTHGDVITSLSDLSLDVLRKAASDGGNTVVSPVSALICLAMMANGADGETRAQIESAVGVDLDTLNAFMEDFVAGLVSYEKCRLSVASSLWINSSDPHLRVSEDFLKANAKYYRSDVYSSDFGAQTLRDLNRWVKETSLGMIDSILEEIDTGAVMYLLSTVAFDAQWQEKYEKKSVRDSAFTDSDGKTDQVRTLFSSENRYLSGEGFTGFVKNYAEGRYAFVGLLPNEGTDVGTLLARLDGNALREMWQSVRTGVKVYASIPAFEVETNTDLAQVFKGLGVTDMFDPSLADFSKMGAYGDDGLYCSSFSQKTVIELDENGTRAASVSIGSMAPTSAPPPEEVYYVYLNRPFVYMIIDLDTCLPVFAGTVESVR